MAIIKTAVIANGVVVDTERYDDATILPPHATLLPRTPCPDYVEAGWRHNGSAFLMPDGSPVSKAILDEDTETKDKSDILTKLLTVKTLLADARNSVGTNAERIKRLEDIVVPVARGIIKLYR